MFKNKLNLRETATIIVCLAAITIFSGCCQTNSHNEKPFDEETQSLITNFSKSIFDREIINSMEILDTLTLLSDTIFVDTAKYFRTPKATVFANNVARTYFRVFENPKGTITAIGFYKNNAEINVAEYFDNGQVMCKFKVTVDGVRDGQFRCYYENGDFRTIGYYRNGQEIKDSTIRYEEQ